MPARHFGQFLDASDPDQSADDVFELTSSPPEIVRGSFTLYYRPRDSSSYAGVRCLLSVAWDGDALTFRLEPSEGGDTLVTVALADNVQAQLGPVTFAAGTEITFTFAAPDGTITLAGGATGNGTSDPGFSWNVPPSILRLGGNVLGGEVARGLVSLPYAVPGAVLPDPLLLTPSLLDFSDLENSGLISLI